MKAIPWPECRGRWHRLTHKHKRYQFLHGVVWMCRGVTTTYLYLPTGRTEVVRLTPTLARATIDMLREMQSDAHGALQALQSDGNQFIRLGEEKAL